MREIDEKVERVARWLAAEKLDGVLIGAQHNFAWATAGGRNGIDQSRDPGAGTLLIGRDGRRWVLANHIEMARLQTEELAGKRFEAVEFPWAEERADPLLAVGKARGLCGAALASDLGLGETRPAEAGLTRLRYGLTPEEVERLKHIGSDAGQVLGHVCRNLKPGVRENEVVRQVTDAMLERDLWPVVLLVAADDRIASYRHPVPKQQVARRAVLVASCVRRGGLIVSLSRIVHFGPVPEMLATRTRLTAGVNADLWARTRPGATGRELYEVCRDSYARAGYPGEELKHHQGGAIGYRTREWVAHPVSQEVVQPSQAFAWNPTITGTKMEETVVAFADRIELVTNTPGWPAIEVRTGELTYALPDVLALN